MGKLSSTNSSSLVKLGFSPHEALIYEILLRDGSLDAKSLAQRTKVLPNALYRLLVKLQNKELITSSGKHPALYHALSPAIALDAYLKQRVGELEISKEQLIGKLSPISNSDQTKIDLLKSTREFFLSYSKLAGDTKKEIAIISIGESVPEEVVLANRDALAKDINIRFIVHKFDKNNRDLLLSWKKMGIKVRHYPDWGFHLVIFDRDKSLLSINNPERTSERIALVIHSHGLAKAHADYFDSTWEKAEEIR